MIVSIADEFVECLNTALEIDSEIKVSEWLARFTTDIIGSCAFGVEFSSLKNPQSEFRRMGRKIFEEPKLKTIERLIIGLNQELAKFIGIHYNHDDVSDFFMNTVKRVNEYRETNNVQRNDFMSLLIALKNSVKETERLTINEVAAQAYVFFIAGFETTSTTLTYCLCELASDKNKQIQDGARREIAAVLAKYNGNLTYEAISEMNYIDQILNGQLMNWNRIVKRTFPNFSSFHYSQRR